MRMIPLPRDGGRTLASEVKHYLEWLTVQLTETHGKVREVTKVNEPDLQGWIEEGRRNVVDVTVAEDPAVPRGYRFVIEATGRDEQVRRIDPVDVVMKEFSSLPIDVTRMLATAELTLHLVSSDDE
ncbi:hypothetical protein ACFWWA_00090 [Streptomyces goshikiensis]|uniref:hypothetical protein n=1 Tax=Streptomyces goshikiensis TaxID=1942 RepID=UPI003659B36D